MSKRSYKIPTDLNQSVLDMEITLQSGDGIGPRPMPIKVIFFALISGLLCFWLTMNTFIRRGPVWAVGLFVVVWLLLTILLMRYDGTKQMYAQMIPSLLGYMPKSARYVITRKNSRANDFYSIANIQSVDEKFGRVNFADGTCGYFYRVAGSASVLLFDDDKSAILDRVDSFYRKISTDVEIIYITVKEPQRVQKQVAHVVDRWRKQRVKDFELQALAQEQMDILKERVGGTSRSIHQYMILRGDDFEKLTVAKNILQSEVENSSLMIKQCTPLYGKDIYNLLRTLYQGGEG